MDQKSEADIPPSIEYIYQNILAATEIQDFKTLVMKPYELKIIAFNEKIRTQSVSVEEHNAILEQIDEIERQIKKIRITQDRVAIIAVAYILHKATQLGWDICQSESYPYIFNGSYWEATRKDILRTFFGKACEKMGIIWDAQHHLFRKELYKQFVSSANRSRPEQQSDEVLLNFKNGTYRISPRAQRLQPANKEDFITYQLPFDYNPSATANLFQTYLDDVLPDKPTQNVLAEYIAYLFVRTSVLKLEKALLLYGSGANGKSVFFDIINALLGYENVCNYSLQSLTSDNSYSRAKLDNKLVNYASEISTILNKASCKQLISTEPIEVRLPYGEPFIIRDYAKMIFNCNELPKDIEHTHAYFRRLIIIEFSKTISEDKQDKQLALKIIAAELSGVLNWALQGLGRLLSQRNFSVSEAVNNSVKDYMIQSDNVQTFLKDEELEKHVIDFMYLKDLYKLYHEYCHASGYHPCSRNTFSNKLKKSGFIITRKNKGYAFNIKKF